MFKRLARVVRAMFGWLIRRAEDPELILRQHIDDLRSRIPEFNRQTAEVVKLEKMLAMQAERLRQKVADLEKQVVAAVKLGPSRKEIAKSLISQLETTKLDLAETEQQLVQAKQNSEQVKRARLSYERKIQQEIQESMRQISRAKRAEMQRQMASLMMSFEVGDDNQVLDQMTQKIDEDLARAEARTEIAQESVGAQMVDISIDAMDQEAEQRYEEYARQLGMTTEEPSQAGKSLDAIMGEVDTTTQTTETSQGNV